VQLLVYLYRVYEYYGHEEGSGSLDTTLKSVYNVPATTGTQLEVYYDAKDLADMPTIVTDLAGGDQNGTVTEHSPTLDTTDGIVSFKFDGTDDYITSTLTGLSSTQYTMAGWIKVDTLDSTVNTFFGLGDWASGNGRAVGIAIDSSNRIGANVKGFTDARFSEVVTGEWYHVVADFTSDNDTHLYVNGKLVDTVAGTTFAIPTNPPLFIGSRANASGTVETARLFPGSIANFRLYSKALNADQVKELYDYQKDYFLGSKSQVTLYKGHLGVGVTEPSGQLELAGDERIQEYPPRALTGYETLVEGHGVFCASASSYYNYITHLPWQAFTPASTTIIDGWNSGDNSTGTDLGYYAETSSGEATSAAALFEGTRGEWVQLKCPYPIIVKKFAITGRSNGVYGGSPEDQPKSGILYGSNDGNNWDILANFSGLTYGGVSGGAGTTGGTELVEVNATKGYTRLVLQATARVTNFGTDDWINIGQLQYFGTPGPTTLDKGSLSLGRSLDVPRISRYDVDTETPRPEKLVVDYDTTVNSSPTDISGQGNHGVFYGTNMKYSSADKAFVFNGTDDYIETSINIGSGGNIPICISVWVKYNADGWWFWLGDETTPGGIGVESRSSGTRIRFVVRSGNYVEINSPGYNMWNHYTFIHTGSTTSDGRMDIYMNGVFIEPVDSRFNYATTNITNNNLRVGDRSSSPNFNGQISNFKMYGVGTILEPSEVQKLYRLGRTGRSMVISDTAVGIGKVPEAQLDVRGVVGVRSGLIGQRGSIAFNGNYTNLFKAPAGSAFQVFISTKGAGGTYAVYVGMVDDNFSGLLSGNNILGRFSNGYFQIKSSNSVEYTAYWNYIVYPFT
jgi:hypothetical protein